jgi:recombination protein RecA
MAKKAKSEDVIDTGDIGMAAIRKKYGDIVRSGTELFDEKSNKVCVSVSPSYDLGLNGGLLEGSWTVISGIPKCGKSSLTLQIIANAQKTGRRGVYADAESRVKAYNLSGTHDLNQSEIEIISGKDEDLSAEDILNTVNAMIRMPKNKGCVCVIDSTSSLLPRDEMDAEVSSKLRAQLPKMLSHWVKQNAQVVVRNDIVMILITHYITNTSGYGKHKLADCGVMVQYQADNRLDFTHVEPWEEGGKKIGQKTICDISCSAMGASGNSVTSYLRFGHGIDFTKEFIELGESFGLIEKAGAWFTLPYLAGTPEFAEDAVKKFQGQQKVYDFISSTPLASEILKKEITILLS